MIKYNQTSQNNIEAQLPIKIHFSLQLSPRSNYKPWKPSKSQPAKAEPWNVIPRGDGRKRTGLTWDPGLEEHQDEHLTRS